VDAHHQAGTARVRGFDCIENRPMLALNKREAPAIPAQ
jgi:hypothetical protein